MTTPTALLTPWEVFEVGRRGPQPTKVRVLPPSLGRVPSSQAYDGDVVKWTLGPWSARRMYAAVRILNVEASLKYDKWSHPQHPGVVVLERSTKRRDNAWFPTYPEGVGHTKSQAWYIQLRECVVEDGLWGQVVK